MKKIILYKITMLLLLTATSFVSAQDTEGYERWKTEQSEFKQAANASASAKTLSERVNSGDTKAILEAGKTGDQTIVPYLKKLAKGKNGRKSSLYAEVALVQLGEAEYLIKIIAETTKVEGELDNNDYIVQNEAIEKLSLLAADGNKQAFRELYELLNDTAPRQTARPSNDLRFLPRSFVVMDQLANIVENPPAKSLFAYDIDSIPLWKAWFAKNNHLIE